MKSTAAKKYHRIQQVCLADIHTSTQARASGKWASERASAQEQREGFTEHKGSTAHTHYTLAGSRRLALFAHFSEVEEARKGNFLQRFMIDCELFQKQQCGNVNNLWRRPVEAWAWENKSLNDLIAIRWPDGRISLRIHALSITGTNRLIRTIYSKQKVRTSSLSPSHTRAHCLLSLMQ